MIMENANASVERWAGLEAGFDSILADAIAAGYGPALEDGDYRTIWGGGFALIQDVRLPQLRRLGYFLALRALSAADAGEFSQRAADALLPLVADDAGIGLLVSPSAL